MVRLLALSFVVLVTAQATPAFAQSINFSAQLSNGSFVNGVCSVGANGQITGTAALYGVNAANGHKYLYPITITRGATTNGRLVLTGFFTGVPRSTVTFSLSVPSGGMSINYIVNGNSYTLMGDGSVMVVR